MLHPYYSSADQIECGCDEAGRGCLAGPVFAAAVILPPDFRHPLLHDSKQLSQKKRDLLRPIIEQEAISWAIGITTAEEIDQINILRASILAMHRAIEQIRPIPSLLLIDGNRFSSYANLPHQCIVKGDATYASIAAASILAKTHRDEYMQQIAVEYPYYHWSVNKGYPTAEHRQAMEEYGLSIYHRRTFRKASISHLPEAIPCGDLFEEI